MTPFFEGYLVGLAFIVFIGPVFFTLLHSTLQSGPQSGISVALGIFSSDLLVMCVSALGLAAFFENPKYQFWIALLGAALLIGLGIQYVAKPQSRPTEQKERPRSRQYFGFFAKGFLINLLNPFVFVVWIGIIGIASSSYTLNNGLLIYLSGVLGGILSTDLLKVAFAHRIKKIFEPQFLIWVYRVIGVGLIGFGVRMLVMGVFGAGAFLH